MSKNVKITVNGEVLEVENNTSIKDIIELLKVENQSIVAEIDGQVVSKNEFENFKVYENAKIELIRFVGGG